MLLTKDLNILISSYLNPSDISKLIRTNKKFKLAFDHGLVWKNQTKKQFHYIPEKVMSECRKKEWKDYLRELLGVKRTIQGYLVCGCLGNRLDWVMVVLNSGRRMHLNKGFDAACRNNYLNIIKYLVKTEQVEITNWTMSCSTLYRLCKNNSFEMIKYILDHSTPVFGKSCLNRCLTIAKQLNRKELVEKLNLFSCDSISDRILY